MCLLGFELAKYVEIGFMDTGATFNSGKCLKAAQQCDDSKLRMAHSNRVYVAECNVKECGYSFGFCNTSLPEHCSRAYGSEEGTCLQCQEGFLQYFGYYLDQCPTGFRPHPQIFSMCMERMEDSSDTDPEFLYVLDDPIAVSLSDGNLYFNFMDALAAAWKCYTVINLLGAEVVFNPRSVFSKRNIDYFRHPSAPDMFKEAPWTSLTIRSRLCSEEELPGCTDSPTTFNFRSVHAYLLTKRTLIFENVKMTTTAAFHYDPVSYCLTLKSTASGYDTDKLLPFSDFRNYHFQCGVNKNLDMFTVGTDGDLLLTVSL